MGPALPVADGEEDGIAAAGSSVPFPGFQGFGQRLVGEEGSFQDGGLLCQEGGEVLGRGGGDEGECKHQGRQGHGAKPFEHGRKSFLTLMI